MNLPSVEQPDQVARAADTLADRERELGAAERELREAKAGLDAARAEDRVAYAAARNRGDDDPGPRNFEAARAHLEDVERRLGGEQLRAEQAQAAVNTALAEHRKAWAEALERAQAKADAASIKAVERLEAAEQARAEVRSARAWLRRPSSAPKLAATLPTRLTRNQNRDLYSLAEVLVAVREALENSSLSADRERDAEREAAEREAEQRLEQRRQMTERAVPAPDRA